MPHSMESRLPTMSHSASRFSSSNLIENFREFESICKTVLAHESGDPGVQFNEKTEGRKSCETVPLRWGRVAELLSSKQNTSYESVIKMYQYQIVPVTVKSVCFFRNAVANYLNSLDRESHGDRITGPLINIKVLNR
jgi:hypothetical protein